MPKDHPRVEAYGSVDELNAQLGAAAGPASGDLLTRLRQLQHELFRLGADLATPMGARSQAAVRRVGSEEVRRLEAWIDETEARLEPLRRFVLPGGAELASRLHLARTVCRRAERRAVALAKREEVNPQVLAYLNRLGDLLFVWARWANRQAGLEDIPWEEPPT